VPVGDYLSTDEWL